MKDTILTIVGVLGLIIFVAWWPLKIYFKRQADREREAFKKKGKEDWESYAKRNKEETP